MDLKRVKSITPDPILSMIVNNTSTTLRAIETRKYINNIDVVRLSGHVNISNIRAHIQQIYNDGYIPYTRSIGIIKAVANLFVDVSYKRRFLVLPQYKLLLESIINSKSRLYMSGPIDNTINTLTFSMDGDRHMVGPAELMTMRQLATALQRSHSIFGNVTSCMHGHSVVVGSVLRGISFATVWSIVNEMTKSQIELMPIDDKHSGTPEELQSEVDTPWPQAPLTPELYAALNLQFNFENPNYNYAIVCNKRKR
jgi:hypothetical protein